MSKLKAGLSSSIFTDMDSESLIAKTAEFGLQGIEWSSATHLSPGDFKKAEYLMINTLRAGLCTCGYASQYRLGLEEDKDSKGTIQDFSLVLQTALSLQAPLIRVWPRNIRPHGLLGRGRLYSHIMDIADRAGAKGITIAVEAHPKSFITTYSELLDLILWADHPYLKICWSPLPQSDGTERAKELVKHTALIHIRNLEHIERINILKKTFYPFFTAYVEHCAQEPHDCWMVLDHINRAKENSLAREIDILKKTCEESSELFPSSTD